MRLTYLQIKMPENIQIVFISKWTTNKVPLMLLDVKKLKKM